MSRDPHAEREASKYSRPIASREFILQTLEQSGEPRKLSRLADMLGIEDSAGREALKRRLRAMERDGQVIRNRRGGYGLVRRMHLIKGRVTGHPDGFGFLKPDDGGDDIFLNAREMRPLLHGDRALVRVTGLDRRGRREGQLVEVLEHHNRRVVGRLFRTGTVCVVVPDNKRIHQDILIPEAAIGSARENQIVVAEIVEQPTRRSQPVGRIVEVLGEHMAPGMEIDIALRAHELPDEWPSGVEAEIRDLGPEVSDADKRGREDIRDLPLVTIDGEDARDFDDAVWCEPRGDGWRLLVAIADVSHYVRRGSALDDEALNRGTSVYFPGRVIPMLPEVLSNGLCSLNPQVDRLCMVCDLTLDRNADVVKARFFEGVMRSAARLTYSEVAGFFDGDEREFAARYPEVVEPVRNLHALYKRFRVRREQRGALDFDSTEVRIEFDAQGKIARLVPLVRNDAHRMIEEFMVAANVAAAGFLAKRRIPLLYRIHDGPGEDRLVDLRAFLRELGLRLEGGDKPSARDFQALIDATRDRPDAHLIQTVLLRSMRLAVYSPDNIGHFGLSYPEYAHFTSPIRRYPDLLVHRGIRHALRGGKPEKFAYSHEDMLELGEHCSMCERRADDATRDAISWLKCEYMLERVGEEFDGIISSVTSFGLFVELNELYVEGLVHVTSLSNDYYEYDPVGHRLRGERAGKVYRLGDPIRVRVVRVDLDEKKIDFDLPDGAPKRRSLRRKSRR